jgi:hypothetical protein
VISKGCGLNEVPNLLCLGDWYGGIYLAKLPIEMIARIKIHIVCKVLK